MTQRGGAGHITEDVKNRIYVAKEGGQFSDPQDAFDAITAKGDAAANNWYTIETAPGVYTGNYTLPDYCSLVGKGGARDVTLTSVSGVTMTLPANMSYIERISIASNPTANGAKAIDAPNGGAHTGFFVGIFQTSATNGITGNLISASSSSALTFDECICVYTMTGTSAGSNTHDAVDFSGTSSLRFLRSDIIAVVGDVDDDVNILNANATGTVENFQSNWVGTITNAAYSGTITGWNHLKDSSSKVNAHAVMTLTGAGSGTANGIKVDSDTNDMTLNSNYNKFTVTGFTNNYHADVATGDVVDSKFDTIEAAEGTIGAGLVNYTGTFADGEALITGGGAFTIDTQNKWHAMETLVPQADPNNITVVQGSTSAIDSFADYSGTVAGTIKATTGAAHNLSTDDYLTITGTTAPNDYNGVYQITVVDADEFYFTNAGWNASTTGTLHHGSHLTIQQRGKYYFNWGFSQASAVVNQNFEFTFFNGTSSVDGLGRTRKFSTGADIGIGDAGGNGFLEKGDVIWFGFRNLDSSGNITLSEGNINIHKIS